MRVRMRLLSLPLGLMLVVLSACAQLLGSTNGTLTVQHAWARPAPSGQMGAVYLTIANGTVDTLQLVEVTSDAAERVEVHRTVVEDGMMRMEALQSLEIAPGETDIVPMGTHLMLINLQYDLEEGDTFPLVLRFDSGEDMTVDVQVRMTAPE